MKYITMNQFCRCVILLTLGLLPLLSNGQENLVKIDGLVQSEFGEVLEGVVVRSENDRTETTTDENGEFTIELDIENSKLIFYKPGYLGKEIEIEEIDHVEISLSKDVHNKEEIIDFGYYSQRRESIGESVSTTRGEELAGVPVANLSMTFAGKLAGLQTQETYSELSRARNSLWIRGASVARNVDPLVVIDGIITSYNSAQTLEYISAGEIESISVLKDATAQALYGIQGGNGVIVIKTKRGHKGKLKIQTRLDQSFQQAAYTPTIYSSAEYARMRNQAALNDGLGSNYLFSEQALRNFESGESTELYPNNNWYDYFVKDIASMQRLGVNVSGGNDKVVFYSNVNLMHQGGYFNTDQERYDPNPRNIWVNYRSNVDMFLNKYLKAYVRLSGNIKREHTPGVGNETIYSSIFDLAPSVYGPLTPEVVDPGSGEIIDEGGEVVTTERIQSPTYGMLNRTGYVNHTVTNINSQFGLNLDLAFLTKGLSLEGVFAYQTNSVGSLSTTQDYERWIRTNDFENLEFIKKGGELNTPLSYGKSHQYYYHITYRGILNYARNFGEHEIGGVAYGVYQNLTKADVTPPNLLPYNRISSGFMGRYGFDNRYFVKAVLGYSGSEQYPSNTRFTITPAVSLNWNISNEVFMKEIDWLSNLSLRGSVGKTANDQSGLARYPYLDNVTLQGGGPIGSLQYLINENQVGNPNIEAEVAVKQNIGLEIGLWEELSFSIDVFKEKMNNMVVRANATIPLYQGIPLNNYPIVNTGVFENKGYELAVNYRKTVTSDFSFTIGGFFTDVKNTVVNSNETQRADDYVYGKRIDGFPFGQEFGYLVDYSNGNGFFNSQEELENANLDYAIGTPRVGDLIFKDLNNDGTIDERDEAPIGVGSVPRISYAIVGGVSIKSFDIKLHFQGVGQYSSIIGGRGIWETSSDGVFGELHRNAWTQERYDNGETITWPALSLSQSVNHVANDFVSFDRSYLRLRNIELGYSLPENVLKSLSINTLRLSFNGLNLLTWDKMKVSDFGPEGGQFGSFPVYKVYSLGLNIEF